MLKKFAIFILIIGAAVVTALLFKDELKQDPGISMIQRDVADIQEKIFTTEPLRFDGANERSWLTTDGVIAETNQERSAEGLKALKESAELRRAAELKVDDMFARQYFEHNSPSGEGPSDLAKQVGYAFVIVGENLALGNFENDASLVDGWMASPGHRENIMRGVYTEIGVAVKRGLFEGKMTWLAVQEFGTPASACPGPSQELSNKIDQGKAELKRQETILQQKKEEIDEYEPKRGPQYEAKVREYNNLIEQYNALVTEIKNSVEQYNNQAESYNQCLASFSK